MLDSRRILVRTPGTREMLGSDAKDISNPVFGYIMFLKTGERCYNLRLTCSMPKMVVAKAPRVVPPPAAEFWCELARPATQTYTLHEL